MTAITMRPTRTQLRDQVAELFREMIFSRDLRPGDRIVQTEWAERLGVSRMPIRDAISRLCAEGVLVIDGVAGSALVADVRLEDIQDSYAVNATLLSLIGLRAAERASEEDLAAIEDVHNQMREAVRRDDRPTASSLNRQFHKLISVAARSPRLSAMLRLTDLSVPHSTYSVEDWPARSLGEHAGILEALRTHNGRLAGELMRRHVESGSELMLAYITSRDADPAPPGDAQVTSGSRIPTPAGRGPTRPARSRRARPAGPARPDAP
jgi:DNA-binding GntR family transcriptional regulator